MTRTFEYPSEISLCEEAPEGPASLVPPSSGPVEAAPSGPPQLAESPLHATLAANTHMSNYLILNVPLLHRILLQESARNGH